MRLELLHLQKHSWRGDESKAVYDCVQLISSFFNPLWVVAVDHKYQPLRTQMHTPSVQLVSES